MKLLLEGLFSGSCWCGLALRSLHEGQPVGRPCQLPVRKDGEPNFGPKKNPTITNGLKFDRRAKRNEDLRRSRGFDVASRQ
jgi:hypothetical protein